jgi:hypothetical protein
VAIALFDELQTPPGVTLVNGVVEPSQTDVVPVIAATTGNALIVTVVVTELVHPFAFVYVYVIVLVPADTPVTTPVIEFIAAIEGSLDDQTPPAVLFVNVVINPTQAVVVPPIEERTGNA